MSCSNQPYEPQQIAQHGGILSHLFRPVTRFANLREDDQAVRVQQASLVAFDRLASMNKETSGHPRVSVAHP